MRPLAALATALVALAPGQGFAAGPPPTVVVVLDNSGSMAQEFRGSETRMDAAKQALAAVLAKVPEGARVGVILLNPLRIGDDWLIPLGPLDQRATRRAIQTVEAQGPTPLGGAMKLGADALLAARAQRNVGDFKLLVVSDGEATDGSLAQRYLPQALARGLKVDVIGVAMPDEHTLASGATSYRRADDPVALEQAISDVVLGETTTDWDDTGAETDFDVLAGLPGEVAAEAIKALTSPSEAPLDEDGGGLADNSPLGLPHSVPNARLPNAQFPNAPQPDPNQDPQGEGGGIGNVFFFLIVAFFILSRLLRAAKRHLD
jgi:hypothetical protein